MRNSDLFGADPVKRSTSPPAVRLLIPILAIVMMLGVIVMPGVLHADVPPKPPSLQEKLQTFERRIERDQSRAKELDARAEGLSEKIEKNRTSLIKATVRKRTTMGALDELQMELEILRGQYDAAEADLLTSQEKAARVGTHLMALSQRPALTFLAPTREPIDGAPENQALEQARSVAVLRELYPTLQKNSGHLTEKIAALEQKQQAIERKQRRIETKMARLQEDSNWLEHLISRRSETYEQVSTEREETLEQVASLAAKSENFKQLLEKLSKERAAAAVAPPRKPTYLRGTSAPRALVQTPRRSSSSFQSGVMMPVNGKVVRRYGEKISAAVNAKGVTIEAQPGATVIAPFEGEVVFADRFRGYGNLVIIEHAGGYHTLLSGLKRLDTRVGQWLLSGEPIGTMPGDAVQTVQYTSGEDISPRQLYVEFRKRGAPINMTPQIAANIKKGRG